MLARNCGLVVSTIIRVSLSVPRFNWAWVPVMLALTSLRPPGPISKAVAEASQAGTREHSEENGFQTHLGTSSDCKGRQKIMASMTVR